MTISQRGLALVKEFESCKLTAYWDQTGWPDGSKRWSIGWGSTHNDAGRVTDGESCTQEQADTWLDRDLLGAETSVMAALRVPVTQGQFDALTSLVYNTGAPAGSTIFRLINEGSSQVAALEFPKWDKIRKGGVLIDSPGLLRRRKAEQLLFTGPVIHNA